MPPIHEPPGLVSESGYVHRAFRDCQVIAALQVRRKSPQGRYDKGMAQTDLNSLAEPGTPAEIWLSASSSPYRSLPPRRSAVALSASLRYAMLLSSKT